MMHRGDDSTPLDPGPIRSIRPGEMSSASATRSQAILRMPIDNVSADLVLHDGERAPVMLFIHGGEDVTRVLCEPRPFVPVVRGGRVCMVARAAIACLVVPAHHAGAREGDLPCEHQQVAVKLRSGALIEGEVRWVPEVKRRRVSDYLNADAPYFIVHAGDLRYFVVKAHVSMVSEL
jgi:hypothetical protein